MLHPAVGGSLGCEHFKVFCEIMAGDCLNSSNRQSESSGHMELKQVKNGKVRTRQR